MSDDIPKVPNFWVSDRDPQGIDIFTRLREERVIFISREIDEELANQTIATLLYLDGEDPGKDIRVQINSPGGSLGASLAIVDTIQQLRSDVIAICIGQAAAASTLLLAAGSEGKRYALPSARIKLHQPSPPVKEGELRDIEIQAREIMHLRLRAYEILAQRTRQPIEQIEQDMERGRFLSAHEALDYGLIDRIVATSRI